MHVTVMSKIVLRVETILSIKQSNKRICSQSYVDVFSKYVKALQL